VRCGGLRKLIAILVIIIAATSIVWMPALTFAVRDEMDKFQYYLKALEYLLAGLREYFNAVIALFKEAIK
jgi:hypothetical protein